MLPSRQDPLPKVAILADTSASMDKRDLEMALGVIDKVLGAHPTSITVYAGDAALGVAQDIFDVKKVKFDQAGGGTDMGRLATEIQELSDPDVIIICTDGETNWPDQKLKAKTVACITRESDSYPVPSWMTSVQLEV
jgi:predicted metal-dependent peptidase